MSPPSRFAYYSGVLLLAFWCGWRPAQAQVSSISYITAEDFSLGETYRQMEPFDITTDSLGYTYYVASNGILRFNGRGVYHLKHSSKLHAPFISFYKDARQRIWVKSYRHGLGLMSGDSITTYRHNDKIATYMRSIWETSYMDRKGTLHLAVRGNGYLTVSKEGEVKPIVQRSSGLHGFVVTRLADGKLFQFSVVQKEASEQGKPYNIYYLHPDGQMTTLAKTTDLRTYHHSSLVQHQDSSWVLSLGSNTIIRGYQDSLIEQVTFPAAIIKLFVDNRNYLWIGTVNQGVHRAKQGEFVHTEQLLGDAAAAVTAQDRNGGLWAKSSDHQFVYIPNQDIERFTSRLGHLPSDRVTHLTTDGKRIFCLSEDEGLTVIGPKGLERMDIPTSYWIKNQRKDDAAPTVLYYDTINQQLCAGYWHQVSLWNGKAWKTIRLDPTRFKGFKVVELQTMADSTLLGTTGRELFTIQRDRMTSITSIPVKVGGVSGFVKMPSGRLWLASNKGIWQQEGREFKRLKLTGTYAAIANQDIYSMAYTMGCVWVRVLEGDIYAIKNNRVMKAFDRWGAPVTINNLFVAPNGYVWGRSYEMARNLFSLRLEQDSIIATNYMFDDLAVKYGSGRRAMVVTHDTIYYGSYGGVFRTPIKALKKEGHVPTITIKEVYVNHQRLSLAPTYDLAHNQNSLYLVFDPISYRLRKPTVRCRLLGQDSVWLTTLYNGIQYTNLPSGTYRFQVQARMSLERWGPIREVVIRIQTPYWETWWFRMLEILGALLVIGGVFFGWYSIQHKRSMLEIEKLKAEQRALRAQMNPHFIFNTLSSIQDLVFSENRMLAVTNIALFAKLMRKILAHSSQELITLEEEIETLTLYLKLEALRFEDRLQFHIEVDPSIDQTTQTIPPMLIQPFVENAIKHGLLNKQPSGGTVTVQFQPQGTTLMCVVEDDGVGRARSAELKAQRNGRHRSFSTRSVNQRIQLLNNQYEQQIALNIVDLYADHNPSGTRIELTIPLKKLNHAPISHY